MTLNSIKTFQDMTVEFDDLPKDIRRKMLQLDDLLDEYEQDDNEEAKAELEKLDAEANEMLLAYKAENEPEAQAEEQKPEAEAEKGGPEDPLPVVDTAETQKVEDNVSENANEEVEEKRDNPYFWFQS